MLINGGKNPTASTAVKSEESKSLKRIGRPRKKHRVSVDLNESLGYSTSKIDTESIEYLANLNSPTKKTNGLLGYFPKKELPNVKTTKVVDALCTETRGRKRKSSLVKTDSPSDTLVKNTAALDMPNGRPRRSCASKSRYDYCLEKSPKATPRTQKYNAHNDMMNELANDATNDKEEESNNIIILDDTILEQFDPDAGAPQTTSKKLAPLFVRSFPKPYINREILKARQAFLHSGVPEILRLEQEKQKQCEQNYEGAVELFPKISHIQQLPQKMLIKEDSILMTKIKLRSEAQLSHIRHSTQRNRIQLFTRRSFGSNLTDCIVKGFQVSCNSWCLLELYVQLFYIFSRQKH